MKSETTEDTEDKRIDIKLSFLSNTGTFGDTTNDKHSDYFL